MAFYDQVTIEVQAGRGGDGSASMRREAHVPRGGADGGDGGDGGDVILVAEVSRRDLAYLRRKLRWKSEDGGHGSRRRSHGRSGAEYEIPVPLGTQAYTEDGRKLCDLTVPGERVVIAKGGPGGRGNTHFVSSVRRAPMFAEIGLPGEEMRVELRLKLMADAALCGLPNAGKSSLLRRISNARPKVGDYPFTTLQPILGTVDRPDGTQLVVVDVPGLLEGAHEGHGMGQDFLSHFERARMLLHVIGMDATPEEVAEHFRIIAHEVWSYDPRIGGLPQIVILSKRDLVDDDHVAECRRLLDQAIVAAQDKIGPIHAIHVVSSATGQGLPTFLGDLFRLTLEDEEVRATATNHLGAPDSRFREGPGFRYPVMDEYRVYRPQPRRRRWRIFRSKEGYRIAGDVGLRDLAADAVTNPARARELDDFLNEHGILRALRMAGARDGSTVDVFGTSLELWWEDTADV